VRSLVIEVCQVVVQPDSKEEISSEDLPDYMIISVGYDLSSCQDFVTNPDAYKQTPSPTTSPSLPKENTPSEAPSIAIRGVPIYSNSVQPTLKTNMSTQSPSKMTSTTPVQPDTKNETIASRIAKNRSLLILFLLFQACFLSGLFVLYLLFVRQYKKQKVFWKFKEDQQQQLQFLTQNGRTNHDAHSLFNEADDELSSTVSFASDLVEKQIYSSGLYGSERLVA
jgi:hypothetical protein